MAGRKGIVMTIKILGAFFIVFGCGAFGFTVAAMHRKETAALRNLIAALDFMVCELQYRLTPLPELCRRTAERSKGVVKQMLSSLAVELDEQISPNVEKCVLVVLDNIKDIPKQTAEVFKLLGQSMGQFDLEGQLKGIESIRAESTRILEEHTSNQENRLRCYQTLGLCAGAAMAILFI